MPERLPISTGTLAVATADTGVCRVGEPAVCVEVYELSGRPGYSFLFQGGGFDGFSPDDVARFLDVQPGRDDEAAAYEFTTSLRLHRDYKRGRFQTALGPPVL